MITLRGTTGFNLSPRKVATVMPRAIAARFGTAGGLGLLGALRLEAGAPADYQRLAAHHYRAGRPGPVTRVLRLVHAAPTVVGRFASRRAPARQVVGVLVVSRPVLNCYPRDRALGGRYDCLDRRWRARRINAEVRTISRVVVHPQWRGGGLSVRLVRAALAGAETRFTEALASMGRVHPFFARAGMRRFEAPLAPAHGRLLEALERAGIEPWLLASPMAVARRLDEMDTEPREAVTAALRHWHGRTAGRRWRRDPARSDLLVAARQRLAARPVYYLADRDEPAEAARGEDGT